MHQVVEEFRTFVLNSFESRKAGQVCRASNEIRFHKELSPVQGKMPFPALSHKPSLYRDSWTMHGTRRAVMD